MKIKALQNQLFYCKEQIFLFFQKLQFFFKKYQFITEKAALISLPMHSGIGLTARGLLLNA